MRYPDRAHTATSRANTDPVPHARIQPPPAYTRQNYPGGLEGEDLVSLFRQCLDAQLRICDNVELIRQSLERMERVQRATSNRTEQIYQETAHATKQFRLEGRVMWISTVITGLISAASLIVEIKA